MLVSWSFHIVSALDTEQISGLCFFKFAKGRSFSLFHQCKAWSSADRRHTRPESALVVGGQLLFRNIYLCPIVFLSKFLRSGVPCRQPVRTKVRCSQCYIWSGSALVASGIMLLNSAVFLLWQPCIQCRHRPEAYSSGVPPSAYLPPIGCSAEHHTTGNVANTGVKSNSAGPDQAPLHEAPHPGRHRLYMSHIWNALLNLASLASWIRCCN